MWNNTSYGQRDIKVRGCLDTIKKLIKENMSLYSDRYTGMPVARQQWLEYEIDHIIECQEFECCVAFTLLLIKAATRLTVNRRTDISVSKLVQDVSEFANGLAYNLNPTSRVINQSKKRIPERMQSR